MRNINLQQKIESILSIQKAILNENKNLNRGEKLLKLTLVFLAGTTTAVTT